MRNKLITFLIDECNSKRKGGLYHKTQVQLAYNSNRIEGSKLTEEQTRYIFETRTIGFKNQDAIPVDDIIETTNHFVAFDFLLHTIDEPLTESIIKEFHRIIKTSTADAQKPYFVVGGWKKLANEVGGRETCKPENVENEMRSLLQWYESQKEISIYTLAELHWRFENIHPFQDGNGRVGRLILFRECLRNSVMPLIIDNEHKMYYYRGLSEFGQTPEFLVGTMQSAQDVYEAWIKYFNPELTDGLRVDK
ncbi:MAG: Fic family protein [Paludibacteraceae bacterium]|nr:Fic family protein [Paludibacteraceae bacterium]